MPGIPIENIETVWPMAVCHFKKFEDLDDRFEIEDYKQRCLSGEFVLWMGRNSKVAVILEVSDYHKGKECDIVTLAGDNIDSWIDELSEIEGWAKRIGCDRMILNGRKAWLRVLKEYELKSIKMVKRL